MEIRERRMGKLEYRKKNRKLEDECDYRLAMFGVLAIITSANFFYGL